MPLFWPLALDSESELAVQDAIDNVLEQKHLTTIIIAHRLSTIRKADVIAVVIDGEIVETGTHNRLMADRNSYYRKLVDKQELRLSNEIANATTTSLFRATKMTMGKRPGNLECYTYLPTGDKVEISRSTSKSERFEAAFYSNAPAIGGMPHLNFVDVDFSYPCRPSNSIFKGFKLSIQCGETVALVGPR